MNRCTTIQLEWRSNLLQSLISWGFHLGASSPSRSLESCVPRAVFLSPAFGTPINCRRGFACAENSGVATFPLFFLQLAHLPHLSPSLFALHQRGVQASFLAVAVRG